MTDTIQTAHDNPLSAGVEERVIGPCRVLMMPTPVQGVVSWEGSFTAHPDMAGGDELVQAITVRLLDKGTTLRDRFALAEDLDNRGAQLHFSSDALRVGFQGKALRDDVPDVVRIMAEELRHPLFDAAEFTKAKAQFMAGLQRTLENTDAQATAALSRRLYDAAHPNYIPPTPHSMAQLEGLTREQVRAYQARHFGARDLLLVFVGDIDTEAVAQALREAFGDWTDHEAPPLFSTAMGVLPPDQSRIVLPDKENVDVRMGHTLSVYRQDPDYVPLYVASYILGGNFSARLMTKIRDEMGLTYGIHARLSGITREYGGHWDIGVTLSRAYVGQGLAATLDEVQRFVDEGPTADELEEKQTTITGAFKVGLATTGGLASTLYRHAIQGFEVAYLDRFPEEVAAVTLDRVHRAVQQHFRPDRFQTALAGTLAEATVSEA